MKKAILLISVFGATFSYGNIFDPDYGCDKEDGAAPVHVKVAIEENGRYAIDGNDALLDSGQLVEAVGKLSGSIALDFSGRFGDKNESEKFRLITLPRLLFADAKEIKVAAKDLAYDSSTDEFAKEYLAFKDKIKKLARLRPDYGHGKLKKFALPEGAEADENDFYQRFGYVSQKTLEEMADKGDADAHFYYALSLLRPIINVNVPYEEKYLDFTSGIKRMEKLSGDGNIDATGVLWRLYSGRLVTEESEGEEEQVPEAYKPHVNDELAEKYRMLLAQNGDAYAFENQIWRLCEQDKYGEAEAFYDTYKKPEYVYPEVVYPMLANALGYGANEIVSSGCMCYGTHIIPNWVDMREVSDGAKAFKWAQELARINPYHDNALVLAHMHLNGIGTAKDERKALEVARKASLSADYVSRGLPGIAYLAYAYGHGIGVEANQDISKAYWEMFYKPVPEDHDSAQAMVDTAKRFYNGFGVPQDKAQALEILKRQYEISKKALLSAEDPTIYINGTGSSGWHLMAIYSGEFDEADENSELSQKYKKELEELDAYLEQKAKKNK